MCRTLFVPYLLLFLLSSALSTTIRESEMKEPELVSNFAANEKVAIGDDSNLPFLEENERTEKDLSLADSVITLRRAVKFIIMPTQSESVDDYTATTLPAPTENVYGIPKPTIQTTEGVILNDEVTVYQDDAFMTEHNTNLSEETNSTIQSLEAVPSYFNEPEILALRAYVDGKLVWDETSMQNNQNEEEVKIQEPENSKLMEGLKYLLTKTRKTGDEASRQPDWLPERQANNQSELGTFSPNEAYTRQQQLIMDNAESTSFIASFRKRFKSPEAEPLSFDPAPAGESYEMEALGITNGIFIFTYLGDFLSQIQPYDFPVDFVRDALWKKMSVVTIIMQALRVEAGFVTCLVVGILLSLMVPMLSLTASCSNMCQPAKLVSDSISMAASNSANSNRRALVVFLFLIVVMIGVGLTAMMVTNEQLSSALLETPKVLTVALSDASNFVRNSQQQISHVTLNGFDKMMSAVFSDLDDVEKLLGEPIQKEIAGETGVDVALDALVDVAAVTDDISKKVAEMQQMTITMRAMIDEARDRITDLRTQVNVLRRSCPSRDRPLCDTIDSSGLEITFKTDALNSDPRLNILRTMSLGKLPQLAEKMKKRFGDIPGNIASETKDIRDRVKQELDHQKLYLERKMWPIESLARDVRLKINGAREYSDILEDGAQGVEQWRWLSIFVVCLLVLLIWSLLTSAVLYGCCDGEQKARSLLIGGLVVSSLLSVILWAVALVFLVVGGHGEVFICRPLYDNPDYKSLTELLDDPGILYQRGGGFIKNLLPQNQSLNVPIRKILEKCERDKTAYEAFELNKILDIDAATNFHKWGEISKMLKNLNNNFTQLEFMDPELQENLQNLLQATSVNMTTHRSQISKPITGKDLTSFAKQLDSVGNQIKDLSTASRIETLASRTRRIITTNIHPLEAKKEELLYLVTALEVQINPIQRQVNQSISHMKTIQYYIDNQGKNISEMKTIDYASRLITYFEEYRTYLLQGIESNVAPCLPIWNVFQGLRAQMCRQVMDPLNGFWFALVWCLLWLIVATPVSIKLIRYFDLSKDGLLNSANNSSISSTQGGNTWSAPGTEQVNNW